MAAVTLSRRLAGFFGVLAILIGLTINPVPAHADLFSISDGETDFEWDNDLLGDDLNILFFNSQVDWQFSEAWFLRFGTANTELLNGTSNIDPAGDSGTITFLNVSNTFDVIIGYSLQESSIESQFLNVEATIINRSTDSANVSLINYFDYDLSGDPDDHSAEVTNLGSDHLRMSINAPGERGVDRYANDATHFQMAEYADLYDSIVANNELDDSGNPFGPGDFTGGFQWDTTLDAGQSITFNSLVVTGVPEPSSVAFLGAAAAILLIRRRIIRRGKRID